MDTIVIGAHNLKSCAPDPVTVQPIYSDDAITYSAGATTTVTADGDLEIEFSSMTHRCGGILITDTGGNTMTINPQVGNLSIGARGEMTMPYDSQSEHGEEYATNARRSVAGTRYASQPFDGIETWKRKWSNISDADRHTLQTVFQSVRGAFRPFYIIDTDGSLRLVMFSIDSDPMQRRAHNFYNSPDITVEAFLTKTFVP